MSQNSNSPVVHNSVVPLFYWIMQGFKCATIIGIPFGLIGILNALVSKGVLTKDRIHLKWGLISSSEVDTTLDKITSVSIEQSIFGRIFNYGFVVVSNSGGDKSFMLTENPSKVKNIIFNEQEKYKESQIAKQAVAMAQAMKSA